MLTNRTPYAAERAWVLDKNALKSWVIAVKATYTWHSDGIVELTDEQEKVLDSPIYTGEPGKSSLLYDGDLLGPKPSTDIVLNGHAYAPDRRPVSTVEARIHVGDILKRVVVSGDRYWRVGLAGGLSISRPEPFLMVPLMYERAYGGWDRTPDDPSAHRMEPRNPVGTGFTIRDTGIENQRLPNVEFPDRLISSWKNRPPPAGFGVIASYWSPRREWAGDYGEKWRKERFPLLAEDYDDRFNQCAAADQQAAGYLAGGESVELVNVSPDGRQAFTLPKVYLHFTTSFGRERVQHRAKLYTVIIEPDRNRLMMVWYSSLQCHHKVDSLDDTTIIEKKYV